MKRTNEVDYKDLKMVCNPEQFDFETTEELDPIDTGIGQDRGIRAIEVGLNVDVSGYNLYMEGPSGVGKTMYAKNYLNTISKKKKVPQDWCYIYNFKNPNEPIAVSLPAGQGKEFKENMDGFIKEVKKDIKKTFNADDFEKEKALIKKEFEEKREVVLTKLNENSQKHGFQEKSAQNGIYMMPIVEGKVIQEEEFEKLDEEIKQVYEEKSAIVQQQIMDAISEIKQISTYMGELYGYKYRKRRNVPCGGAADARGYKNADSAAAFPPERQCQGARGGIARRGSAQAYRAAQCRMQRV